MVGPEYFGKMPLTGRQVTAVFGNGWEFRSKLFLHRQRPAVDLLCARKTLSRITEQGAKLVQGVGEVLTVLAAVSVGDQPGRRIC